MAEQLLVSGCIDEAQLQSMDMVRARSDIGITLLSYSGIASYSQLVILIYDFIYNYIVDMRERCTLCGAGDDSLSHPDYATWVSGCS